MDFDKIFIKDCNPTKMGGQAVIEGIMMRGTDRMAVAVRREDGTINVRETPIKPASRWMQWPIIRGVVSFVSSLVIGTSTLMYSAEVLEEDLTEEELEPPGKVESWINGRFGEKAAFNFLLYSSVIFALVFSILVFVLLPTWIVGLCGKIISNAIALNLIEGVLRMIMFLVYIAAISLMKDIQRVFEYHGAEHQTIHCYENGLELTPENCMKYERLHPRCGTSFLMFVLIISLLLFSFLGWPNLVFRILSRLVLIPVIAGLSYEVLRWAGRSDSMAVKILSVPGLLMQKITTRTPDESQLEVAIVAVKACLMERPAEERIYDVDSQGNPIERKKKELMAEKTEPEANEVKKETEPVKEEPAEEAKPKEEIEKTGTGPIAFLRRTFGMDLPDQDSEETDSPEVAGTPASGHKDVPKSVKSSEKAAAPDTDGDLHAASFTAEEGLWSGEKRTLRMQYLYDLRKVMRMTEDTDQGMRAGSQL